MLDACDDLGKAIAADGQGVVFRLVKVFGWLAYDRLKIEGKASDDFFVGLLSGL